MNISTIRNINFGQMNYTARDLKQEPSKENIQTIDIGKGAEVQISYYEDKTPLPLIQEYKEISPDGYVTLHFIYDINGTAREKTCVSKQDGATYTDTTFYNAKGKKIEDRRVSEYGKITCTNTIIYDEDGNIEKECLDEKQVQHS